LQHGLWLPLKRRMKSAKIGVRQNGEALRLIINT
jgi:hypothetical protein